MDRKGALREMILETVPGKRVACSPQVAGCKGWREQSGDCGGAMQADNTREGCLSRALESRWSRRLQPGGNSSQLDWTQEETERESWTAVCPAKEFRLLPAGSREPLKVHHRAIDLEQVLPFSRLHVVTPKHLGHRPQAQPGNQLQPVNQSINQSIDKIRARRW